LLQLLQIVLLGFGVFVRFVWSFLENKLDTYEDTEL